MHVDSAGINGFTSIPSENIDILNIQISKFGYAFSGVDRVGETNLLHSGAGTFHVDLGKPNRNNLLHRNEILVITK